MPNTVFVGGIDIRMDEIEIRDFFARFGAVKEVKIITDRTGVSKGYGFVSFHDDVDVQKIVDAYPYQSSPPVIIQQIPVGYQQPPYNYQLSPQWTPGEQRGYIFPQAYAAVNYHCADMDQTGTELIQTEFPVHEPTQSSGNSPQKNLWTEAFRQWYPACSLLKTDCNGTLLYLRKNT
nr:DAZL isoform III [Cynops cyanurus]